VIRLRAAKLGVEYLDRSGECRLDLRADLVGDDFIGVVLHTVEQIIQEIAQQIRVLLALSTNGIG